MILEQEENKPEEKQILQITYKSKNMKIKRGAATYFLDPSKYEISS